MVTAQQVDGRLEVGWSRRAVRYAVEATATVLLVVGLQAGRPIQIAPLAPVNRVAIAMQDDTPQAVQHQLLVTPPKAALGRQLGHAIVVGILVGEPPVHLARPAFRVALVALVVRVRILALVQAAALRVLAARGVRQDTAAARSALREITNPALGKAAVLLQAPDIM